MQNAYFLKMSNGDKRRVVLLTQEEQTRPDTGIEEYNYNEGNENSTTGFHDEYDEMESLCTQEIDNRLYPEPMTEDIGTDFGFLLTQESQIPTRFSPIFSNYCAKNAPYLLEGDGNQLSSSDDDSSTDSPGTNPASVSERRAQNVRRNEERMLQLGITHGLKKRTPQNKRKRAMIIVESDNYGPARSPVAVMSKGMLKRLTRHPYASPTFLSPPTGTMQNDSDQKSKLCLHNETESLSFLYDIFPGRQPQIEQLYGILHASINLSGKGIPPPIFVTGSSGTGRTSVTQYVIQALVSRIKVDNQYCSYLPYYNKDIDLKSIQKIDIQNNCDSIGSYSTKTRSTSVRRDDCNLIVKAYVNCATSFEQSCDIDSLTNTIYSQIKQELLKFLNFQNQRNYAGDSYLLRLGKQGNGRVKDCNSSSKCSPCRLSAKKENRANRNTSIINVSYEDDNENTKNDDQDEMNRMEELENRMEEKQFGKKRSKVQFKALSTVRERTIPESVSNMTGNRTLTKGQTTVWNLGRALVKLFQKFKRSVEQDSTRVSTIIVLDNAERMISQAASTKKSSFIATSSPGLSYLSQLLLLPQTIGLNISIVVITNSILLEHTGMFREKVEGFFFSYFAPNSCRCSIRRSQFFMFQRYNCWSFPSNSNPLSSLSWKIYTQEGT